MHPRSKGTGRARDRQGCLLEFGVGDPSPKCVERHFQFACNLQRPPIVLLLGKVFDRLSVPWQLARKLSLEFPTLLTVGGQQVASPGALDALVSESIQYVSPLVRFEPIREKLSQGLDNRIGAARLGRVKLQEANLGQTHDHCWVVPPDESTYQFRVQVACNGRQTGERSSVFLCQALEDGCHRRFDLRSDVRRCDTCDLGRWHRPSEIRNRLDAERQTAHPATQIRSEL